MVHPAAVTLLVALVLAVEVDDALEAVVVVLVEVDDALVVVVVVADGGAALEVVVVL